MRNTFLPFSPPAIGDEEIQEVTDTLRSGWITTGPKTKLFETEFSKYLSAPDSLALSSGTAALHTALASLDIGPGDEVITTAMTFCSTVHVIEQVGATPVIVDVQADTLNIDPERVAAAVTSRTRAIMPVHYGGHPCDMDSLHEIATQNSLDIIEDAAHALPAKYKGRFIGSGENPVAFSFYATKNLTTGEGGMLTAAPDLLARARVLSLHGMDHDAWKRYDQGGSWYYEVVQSGFKYNMTDIQAAIGLWQLKKIQSLHERRKEIATIYQAKLKDLVALEIPKARPDVDHAWHLFPIRLIDGRLTITRDRFIAELVARNIGASVHFIPIHIHPYFSSRYNFSPQDFPQAYSNFLRLISLPIYPTMKQNDIEDVVDTIHEMVHEFRI